MRGRAQEEQMPTSVKEMLAAANGAVPRVSPDEARRLMAEADALVVDVRDGTEVAKTGKIKGAVHVSRGMIEFKADAETPYHDAAFRKDRPVILYCASGGRSALAGRTLQEMGYERVHNLGGFKEATEAGLETEPA
jgi:rhodanese-related sulfurtransferase